MSDEELIARLRSMHWCVTTKANGVGVSDEAVAPEAADRIEALIVENAKLHDHIEGVAKGIHKIMVGYEAKLEKATELAELIRRYAGLGMNPSTDLQHMASDLLAILE